MLQAPFSALEKMFEIAGYRPSLEQRAVHEALLRPCSGATEAQGEEGPLPTMVVLAGGEQAGKTLNAAMHAFGRWMLDPLVWLVGNRYEDAAKEYEFIRDAAVAIGKAKKASYAENGPWELQYSNGHEVKVLASDDASKLAREAPDGIVMCEPGRQSYESFRYLYRRAIPRTAWILVAGTFERDKGAVEPWYAELWEQCHGDNPYQAKSLSLPSHANRSIYPLGARDSKFLAALRTIRDTNRVDPDDEIGERFFGIPRKHQGAVFSRNFSRQVHVRNSAEYLPGIEVHLAIDPGFANAFAVLFIQVVSGQIRVFDEIYQRGTVSDDIITMVENHQSFPDVSHIVIDIAAKQHANAEKSAYEHWVSYFSPHGITVSGRYVAIEDGLLRTRQKLKVDPVSGAPGLIIHSRCVQTIWEFEQGYRYHEQRHTGIIPSEKPIDANNHSAKAIAYYIVDRYGYSEVRRPLPKPTVSVPPYDRAFIERRQRYAGSHR